MPTIGPWRTGVAVANVPVGSRPSDVGHPGVRPLALLRDAGFEVHAVTRGTASERRDLDGVTAWVEPGTVRTVRRMVALRPELLFVDSSTYGVLLGTLAARSWIRNPLPAAHPRLHQLQRVALRGFDAVSFTNPFDRSRWAVRDTREVDLPYPVDVRYWSASVPRRESWWTERGWSVPQGHVLVSNAAYTRNKRLVELLDALAPFLAANPSDVLILAGHRSVEPDVTEMIGRRPAELGIGEQVMLTGWISRAEIRELLAWASVTIINSRLETQCMAVYEALAAGVPTLISAIPVLTSQFPSLPAHADDQELRSNLKRVLADPPFARSLIESSREQVAWADMTRHDEMFHSTLQRLLGRVPA